MERFRPFALAAGLLSASVAFAQSTAVEYNVQYMQAQSAFEVNNAGFIGSQILAADAARRNAKMVAGGGGHAAAQSPYAHTRESDVRVNLHYTPSREVSRQMQAGFLANVRKRNPALADTMTKIIDQEDPVSRVDGYASRLNLHTDDLGDMATLYWLASWRIANGKDDPSPAQVHGAREQMRAQLAAHDESRGDRLQRQRLAEIYIYKTFIDLLLAESATTAAARRQQADNAADDMRRQGVDIRQLLLTDAGFVKA